MDAVAPYTEPMEEEEEEEEGEGKGGGGRRREDDARCLNNRASSGCGFEGTGGGAHYTRGGGSGDRVVASV